MAVVVIDLLGDEDDGIVKVVEKTTPVKPFAQKRQDAPHTQLEIVQINEEKREKTRDRRIRKTNIHGSIPS